MNPRRRNRWDAGLGAIFFLLQAAPLLRGADAPPSDSPAEITPEVSVVGLCRAPLDASGWWDADGEPLPEPPTLAVAKPNWGKDLKHDPDEVVHLIVLRAKVPAGSVLSVKFPGQKLSVRLPETVDGVPWETLKAQAKEAGEAWEPKHAETIVYGLGTTVISPRDQATIQGHLDIANGPWETVGARPRQANDGQEVTFDLAEREDGQTHAFDPATSESNVRVMAEDREGALHAPSFQMNLSGGDNTVLTHRVRYKLPVAEIVAYHLQARPYERFQLTDLPLIGGNASTVERIGVAGGVFGGDLDVLSIDDPAADPNTLDWCNVVDAQLTALRDVPSLRRVYLASDALSDNAADRLAGADQIEHLRIDSPHLTSAFLAKLSLDRLKTLEIQGGCRELEPHALADLAARLPRLECLRLWSSALQDRDLQAISQLGGLRELRARGPRIGAAAMKHLAKLSRLETLALDALDVPPAALRPLEALTHLQSLSLTHSTLGDPGLARLARLASLRKLDLRGTEGTTAGYQQLAKLPALEWIDLRQTQAQRSVYDSLHASLPEIYCRLPRSMPKRIQLTASVEYADQTPVEDAEVYVATAEEVGSYGGASWGPRFRARLVDQGETDASGTCQFDLEGQALEEELILFAVDPRGRLNVARARSAGRQIDVSVTIPQASTRLRLIDSRGKPLAGVEVYPLSVRPGRFLRYALPAEIYRSRGLQRSNAAGEVTLPGFLPSQLVAIGFTGDAIGNQSTGSLRNLPADETPLTVMLQEPQTIAGEISGRVDDLPRPYEAYFYSDRSPSRLLEGVDADLAARHVWDRVRIKNGELAPLRLGQGSVHFVDRGPVERPNQSDPAVRLHYQGRQPHPTREGGIPQLQAVQLVPVVGVLRNHETWDPAADLPLIVRHGNRHSSHSQSKNVVSDASGRYEVAVLPGEFRVSANHFLQGQAQSIASFQWRGERFNGPRQTLPDRQTYTLPIDYADRVTVQGRAVDHAGEPLSGPLYGYPVPPEEADVTNCTNAPIRDDGTFAASYPITHPPVFWRIGRDQPLRVESTEPLRLVPAKPQDADSSAD